MPQEEALARKATQAGSDIARAEAQAGQALEETKAGREFAVGEAKAGRSFASGEAAAGREFAGSEKALDRAIDQRKIKIAQDELALNEQISLSNLRRQQEAAAQPKPASTIDKLITGQMGTELIERLIGRPLTDKEKLWLPQHQLLGTDLETLDPRKARIKLGFPTF